MRFAKENPVKIIVIGAGGTGGYLIPHLYRIAQASNRRVRVIICDGDIVEEKNLVRQNFIYQDIGQNKAKILSERYAKAFGIETEYVPDFIESFEKLQNLCKADFYQGEKVILIGAVDNNRSRQICHEVFRGAKNLIYIDSGNGESTGQVVCGVKQNGRTTYKPVCSMYPDIAKEDDKLPSELSCAERSISAPQSVTANLMAATAVVSFLYNLLIVGDLKTRSITFSSKQINMRADIVSPRKRRKEAA